MLLHKTRPVAMKGLFCFIFKNTCEIKIIFLTLQTKKTK